MKRVLTVAAFIAVALLASGSLPAQSNDPFIGTWKLNTQKSKYVNTPSPATDETRIVEAQGNGAKISLEGTNGDGSRIAYSYVTNYDGKDSPVTGTGAANREDSVAIKRVDAYTFTATTKRAGKVLRTVHGEVSKDGKVTTLVAKGPNSKGEPAVATTVWEKQ